MKSGQSHPQKLKAERQQALRELLQSQGHLQHVIDLQNELMNFDKEMDKEKLERIKVVIDSKLKLIKKYIPDLSSVTLDGEIDIHPVEKPVHELTEEELEAVANGRNIVPISS